MRGSEEGRRGGGGRAVDYRWSPLPYDLSPSEEQDFFLFKKKKKKDEKKRQVPARLSESRCVLRCVFHQQKRCNSTQTRLNDGLRLSTAAASIGTNQPGELSHASENATLRTCGLNLQRLHTNGLVSWDGENATGLTPISLLLFVCLP